MNKQYGYDAKELGLDIFGYSGLNEVICKCPNINHDDKNPSASFNVSSGLLYCFSCSYTTNAYQLAKKQGIVLEKRELIRYKQDSEQLWLEFIKSPLALKNDYLSNRGVTDLDVIDFDIRQIKRGVVFLLRNIKGKFVGCQIRQYSNYYPRYLTFGERIPFDLTKYVKYDLNRPVYLTEGVFGAIRGYQYGYQTLATMGAMINQKSLEFLVNYPKIYGVFDSDEAGINASVKLLKILPHAKIILGATPDDIDWTDLHTEYEVSTNLLDVKGFEYE